jgi:ABC-type transport system involved in cytochrome bd biosynthesis fused ATPase/permease subunit
MRRRLTRKEKVEILIGRFVGTIIQSLILTAILFGIIYLIGLFTAFVETHTWMFIPLGLMVFGLLLKMASE